MWMVRQARSLLSSTGGAACTRSFASLARRRDYSGTHTPKEIVEAVRVAGAHLLGRNDSGVLTRSGLVTGMHIPGIRPLLQAACAWRTKRGHTPRMPVRNHTPALVRIPKSRSAILTHSLKFPMIFLRCPCDASAYRSTSVFRGAKCSW